MTQSELHYAPRDYRDKIAIDCGLLASDARLRGVIIMVRTDAAHHRDVNHGFANALA